jgi:hypothetical protein
VTEGNRAIERVDPGVEGIGTDRAEYWDDLRRAA